MADMYNELDIYNKDTESESVEEPDNKESTQHQPALNTSTGLLSVPTSAAGSSSSTCIDSAPSVLSRPHSLQPAEISRINV